MTIYVIFTILPFLVCAFWTAIYLLDWRFASPARHVLTVFLAVCTLLYLCHTVFFSANSSLKVYANCIYTFCNLAVFPLYYLYICRLTVVRRITATDCLVLLPAAAVCILSFVSNFALPSELRLKQTLALATRIIFVAQLIPVAWYGYNNLQKFNIKINELYSNTEYRSVSPTEWIMWLLIACSFVSAIANYFGREYFLGHPTLIAIPSAVFSVMLFALGYVGVRQVFTIDDLLRDEIDYAQIHVPYHQPIEKLEPVQSSQIEEEYTADGNAITVYDAIERLMNVERLYLNPDLRLLDVAKRLGVGRTMLSSAINRYGHQSFSDYVNSYRIKHACQLIEIKGSTASLITISEESGFSSESTFYRIFRKATGKTPKQWLQQNVSPLTIQ